MLFLLNETVLDLATAELSLEAAAHRYRRLSLEFVGGLGAELFSADPTLPTSDPDRALRLAVMIRATSTGCNAAQFVAPSRRCRPQAVSVRFETVAGEIMTELATCQKSGKPTRWLADSRVWGRLAA